MFDNLGTALVQALGFFAVFGFFVYQTLFADSKPKKSKSIPKKTKISDKKESIKKEPKKGLFNRKSKPVEDNLCRLSHVKSYLKNIFTFRIKIVFRFIN